MDGQTQCTCDPSFSDDALFDTCSGCIAYDIGVIVCFLIVLLYTIMLFVFSIRQDRSMGTLKIFVYLSIGLTCITRIARYSIVLHVEGPEADIPAALKYLLTFLYGLPLVLMFIAWGSMVFAWGRMYLYVKNPTVGKQTIWNWGWGVPYIVTCVVVGTIWMVIVLVDSFANINFLLNGYTALVVTVLNVAFLISGRLFTKSIQATSGINQKRLATFKRMHRFIMSNASIFVFNVFVLLGISVVTFLTEPSKWWFILRQSIYRILEIIPALLILGVYTPPIKELCAGSTRWREDLSTAANSTIDLTTNSTVDLTSTTIANRKVELP